MQYKQHIEKFLETLPQTFSIFSDHPPAPVATPKVEPNKRPPLKLNNLCAEMQQHIKRAAKEEGLSEDSKEVQMLQDILNTFNNIGTIVKEQSKKEVGKEQIIDEVKDVIKRDLETIRKNYDAR